MVRRCGLGFPHYGDEYKIMGLAPYGEPSHLKQMRQIVKLEADGGYRLNLDYFRHHREKIDYEWENGEPSVGTLFSPELARLLGPARAKDEPLQQRHRDIARSVQAMYEEAYFHLLNTLHGRHQIDNLAIAGGCGMNSVANDKVTLRTPFKNVYVQSAAGDAGGAIGAAYSVWHESGGARGPVMDHAYWGPGFTDDQIRGVLDGHRAAIEAAGCSIELVADENELCRRTLRRSPTDRLSAGSRAGWNGDRAHWATDRSWAIRAAPT